MRIYLGAFGDPGHAFPMIALGGALVERGHTVALDTWQKWREPVEAAGMTFTRRPSTRSSPPARSRSSPTRRRCARRSEIRPFVHDFAADVAVADILTPGPALAAELEGVPLATLVPARLSVRAARASDLLDRGAASAHAAGRCAVDARDRRFVEPSLQEGRAQYNETRRRLGLDPLPWVHTALSRELTMVGTLPHLEYPRRWERWVRVVGPLQWEPPGERIEPPPGRGPVVLIAPSTSQDPSRSPARGARGPRRRPVRVIATSNGRAPAEPIPVPANAVLVPWLSYAKTMPLCDVVVLHGGHGTLVRALAAGCSVVVCPVAGDMNENAARVGLGRRRQADPAALARRRARCAWRSRARCAHRCARGRRRSRAGRPPTTERRPRSSSRPGPRSDAHPAVDWDRRAGSGALAVRIRVALVLERESEPADATVQPASTLPAARPLVESARVRIAPPSPVRWPRERPSATVASCACWRGRTPTWASSIPGA